MVTAGDLSPIEVTQMLAESDCDKDQAEGIYRLTSIAPYAERFVIPPMYREEAIELMEDPLEAKGYTGVGRRTRPERGG